MATAVSKVRVQCPPKKKLSPKCGDSSWCRSVEGLKWSYQQRPASHIHHGQPRPRRPPRPLRPRPLPPLRPPPRRPPLRPRASADVVVAVTASPDTAIAWRKYTPTIAVAARTLVTAFRRIPPDMFPAISSILSPTMQVWIATPARQTHVSYRLNRLARVNALRPNWQHALRVH